MAIIIDMKEKKGVGEEEGEVVGDKEGKDIEDKCEKVGDNNSLILKMEGEVEDSQEIIKKGM